MLRERKSIRRLTRTLSIFRSGRRRPRQERFASVKSSRHENEITDLKINENDREDTGPELTDRDNENRILNTIDNGKKITFPTINENNYKSKVLTITDNENKNSVSEFPDHKATFQITEDELRKAALKIANRAREHQKRIADPSERPSYLPNYIRPLGLPVHVQEDSPSAAEELACRLERCEKESNPRKTELAKNSFARSQSTPIMEGLKQNGPYQEVQKPEDSDKLDPVCVKDAVAAMEARLNDNEKPRASKPSNSSKPPPPCKPPPLRRPPRSKPPTLNKPVHLAPKKVQHPAEGFNEIADRETRHRRSTSDLNLDVPFEKKHQWSQTPTKKENNKVNNGPKADKTKPFNKNYEYKDDSNNNIVTKARPTTDRENKSVDASKKNQPIGSLQKSFLYATNTPKHATNDDETSTMNSFDRARSNSPKSLMRPPPSLPPRPNQNKAWSESGDNQKPTSPGGRRRSGQKTDSEVRTSLRSNSLSMTEKAMLFGGSKGKSDAEKSDDNSSPALERRSSSMSHNSDRRSSDGWVGYSRQRNDSEITTFHKDRLAKKKENNLPAVEQQNKLLTANGRRVKRHSGDSTTSLDSYDDDDGQDKSFLGRFGRRYSKDANQQQPVERSENSFLHSSKSNSLKKSQLQIPIEKNELEGYRRPSALHSAVESKGLSGSSQGNIKQFTQELELTLSKSGSFSSHGNSTQFKTSDRERANTGYSAKNRPMLPPTACRSPQPVSENGNRVSVGKKKEKQQRPPPPTVPPPRKPLTRPKKKPAPSDYVTSNSTAYLQSPDTQGQFNILKINNNVAKEFDGEDPKPRSGSICSNISIDSGFRTSLEVPSKGVNMSEWSDFDNSDEDDSVLGTSLSSSVPENRAPISSVSEHKETNETKLHNIAKELLSTEESYVAVLHLIDQVFHKQILEAAIQKHIMPEQVVNNIFCHIPAIYQFHSSFLLPQLKERLENWETKPKIGDIMTRAAPFLKMYSLYVQNFDEAMNMIKLWSEKSSSFKAIVESIQKTPECQFLTLQHHMLGPVQRVPRYRLLLADYMKRLPQDSDDRQDAETALDLITNAATHSNEVMKKIEKFHQLVNVFNSLVDVQFDIVDVTRELLKEGKITKISARNGEKYERYLYLFSDMLLCCTPIRRLQLQSKTYKVAAKIDLDGMNMNEVKNQSVPFAFRVNGLQRSMEFATNSAEETENWMSAIQSAIDDLENRRQTFRTFATEHGTTEDGQASPLDDTDFFSEISDVELGTRAPRWVKDQEVTMCQICSKTFNKLRRRRHHCRACGRVVCAECSEHKFHLQYDPGKSQKVCSRCFNILNGRRSSDFSEKKGVLEVEADIMSVDSILAEYLFCCESEKKKNWTKTWCVIPKNELCLYLYGAHQDIKAQTTVPLPGYQLATMENCFDHKHCFKLSQGRNVWCFGSNDAASFERWMFALGKASLGEDITRDEVWNCQKSQNQPESDGNSEE